MPNDPDFTTLAADLSQARASREPEQVTLADCRSALATLKDSGLLDKATIIRHYEHMLAVIEIMDMDDAALRAKIDRRRHDRRQGLPNPEGKAIRDRAAGDRRQSLAEG